MPNPITRPGSELTRVFTVEARLLEGPAAQAARLRGLLLAKQQALRAAMQLLVWGRWLTWGIIFVSAIHIWETVAAIAPPAAGTLHLPPALYHGAALAFTLMIDACALYIGKANAAAAFAGLSPNRWTLFFYLVTALLNAAFVARYAPGLDAGTQGLLLPMLNALFVLLLPISVPAGIVAVEASSRALAIAHLALLVEVTTLRELDQDVPRTITQETCVPADQQDTALPVAEGEAPFADDQGRVKRTSEPDLLIQKRSEGLHEALPIPQTIPLSMLGGRPVSFTHTSVVAALQEAGTPLSPLALRERLRCGETTIHRLLQEALEAGLVTRSARGQYMVADKLSQ